MDISVGPLRRLSTKELMLLNCGVGEDGRRQWHPTSVLLPGKSHRQRSLEGCHPWGHKESDTTGGFTFTHWRRILRVPWTARRLNQPILKEISLEYTLEGLTLKLELQYFRHLMCRAESLEKTLMLGKTEGKRRRGQ